MFKKHSKQTIQEMVDKASKFLFKKNYLEALEHCNKALIMDPEFIVAYAIRGAVYLKIGEFSAADSDFAEIIQLDGNSASTYFNCGFICQGIGEYQQAIHHYTKALILDPTIIDGNLNRGNAYRNIGEFAKAIQDYSKAIRLNSKNSSAYFYRGNTYYLTGDYQASIQNYTKAIEIAKQFSEAFNNRALAYQKLREQNLAAQKEINKIKQAIQKHNIWLNGHGMGERLIYIGKDFTKYDLRALSFIKAKLDNCIFHKANLTGANFHGADLENADFREANLTNVIFFRANLKNAKLCGANLTKAIFIDANLDYANLYDAVINDTLISENEIFRSLIEKGKRDFIRSESKRPILRALIEKGRQDFIRSESKISNLFKPSKNSGSDRSIPYSPYSNINSAFSEKDRYYVSYYEEGLDTGVDYGFAEEIDGDNGFFWYF